MATLPETTPTWGTDGGAEITDPGDSKRATGFLTAEAPAAGHMNHQLNSLGEWVEYLRDRNRGPQTAFDNMDYSLASDFPGVSNNNTSFTYLPGFDRFYYTDHLTGEIFDSADFVTWSSATALNILPSTVFEYNGDLYGATSTDCYKSTTGLVTDFAAQSVTLSATMTSIASFAYDATNGYFILGGTNGSSDTVIDTSPDLATTFTNRVQWAAGGSCTRLKSSPSGISIGIATAGSRYYYSSNGTTWTNKSTSGTPLELYYNTQLDLFLYATNAATDYHGITRDGANLHVQPAHTNDIHAIINAYDHFWIIEEKDGSDIQLWQAIYGGAAMEWDSFKLHDCKMHAPANADTIRQRLYVGTGQVVDCQKPGFITFQGKSTAKRVISNY